MTISTTSPSPLPKQEPQPQPSHSNLIKVHRGSQPFSSSAISLTSLPPGSLLASMYPHSTPAREADYTTVQTSSSGHLFLNSDLVYCNHSCDPNLVFDMKKGEVRVVDDKKLEIGDDLTFFYPSSEWEMRQPFQCHCQRSVVEGGGESNGKGEKCLGWIAGAKLLDDNVLNKHWLNEHILELMEKRRSGTNGEGAAKATTTTKERLPN